MLEWRLDAMEPDSTGLNPFPQLEVELVQRLGLFVDEAHRHHDHVACVECPDQRLVGWFGPRHPTVGMILIAQRILGHTDGVGDGSTRVLHVLLVPAPLFEVRDRGPVSREVERHARIVRVEASARHEGTHRVRAQLHVVGMTVPSPYEGGVHRPRHPFDLATHRGERGERGRRAADRVQWQRHQAFDSGLSASLQGVLNGRHRELRADEDVGRVPTSFQFGLQRLSVAPCMGAHRGAADFSVRLEKRRGAGLRELARSRGTGTGLEPPVGEENPFQEIDDARRVCPLGLAEGE